MGNSVEQRRGGTEARDSTDRDQKRVANAAMRNEDIWTYKTEGKFQIER